MRNLFSSQQAIVSRARCSRPAVGVVLATTLFLGAWGEPLRSSVALEPGPTPVFVDIAVESSESTMNMTARDHRARAAELAARAVSLAAASPNSPIALRVQGAPRLSPLLSPHERDQLGSDLTDAEIDAAYDGAMLALLARVHEAVADAVPGRSVGFYGFPVEDSELQAGRVDKANQRFASLLRSCDIVISAHSIFASGSNETIATIVGNGLSQARQFAGDRPILFRFNGAWTILESGESSTTIASDVPTMRLRAERPEPESLASGEELQSSMESHAPPEGAGATARDTQDEGSNTSDLVPDPRPGILVPCAGAGSTTGNPLGLRAGQHLSPAHARAFYRSQYQRAERLGVERVIWHMPAGFDEEGMAGRTAVLSVMGERGPVFLEEAAAFRTRNPDASVGVYISSKVPQTIYSTESEDILPWEIYDHENERHYQVMIEDILRPLAEAGFREVWFDNGSLPAGREDMLKLCDELRIRFGMHTIIEAYPRTMGELDTDYMPRLGSAATHRFNVIANELRGFDPWVAPADTEMILLLSRHLIEGAAHRSTPRMSDVQDYMSRGMLIFSMDQRLDMLLEPAIAQWQNSQ